MSEPSAADIQGNFLQLLHYCRLVLGGHKRLASQRELADALCVAATMAGRYLSGDTDFYGMRAVTVELLAKAAQVDVGTVFLWVAEGREVALAHEERVRQEPVAFSALEHLRTAVRLLEDQEEEEGPLEQGAHHSPQPPKPDYRELLLLLEVRRGLDGEPIASLFDTLVETLAAGSTLERVRQAEELEDGDWVKLQQLLGVPAEELRQRFGGHRTPARTAPMLV